jgi:glutamyl-tRNA synthetase
MTTVRTRFAPSPTGHVHIGNMRAAIYNWLFARSQGGQFLLRVEDTDRERSTPEAIKTLLEAMEWLKLEVDEEPMYQSQRMEAHLEAAETLLSKGLAYKEDKGGLGQGECILFKMPPKDISFEDEIKGTLSKKAEHMQDMVIVRSNGTPVFHLANVLDDIEMGITHVIRGDDHIENTYRHIALYEALGAPPPKFAHLPMIVNAQGKPYSKRDGDAFVGDFRDKGFLPEALFNYLALLGWSPGDDREVMSMQEMAEAFDLKRCQSSAAQVDLRKLLWMNGEYLQKLPTETFESLCFEALNKAGITADPAYAKQVFALMRDRLKNTADLTDQTGFFFTENYPCDEKAFQKKMQKEGVPEMLTQLEELLGKLNVFDEVSTDQALHGLVESSGLGFGAIMAPLRIAVSGQQSGPDMFPMLAVLGKERVLRRIQKTKDRLNEVTLS